MSLTSPKTTTNKKALVDRSYCYLKCHLFASLKVWQGFSFVITVTVVQTNAVKVDCYIYKMISCVAAW